MGYTTEFDGSVSINPPLNEAEISFLHDLADTRRMNRTKGPLYVGNTANFGQDHAADILDYNSPHPDQPGLWLKWDVNEDGTEISWNGDEKFYDSEEWMIYLINNLFSETGRAYVAQNKVVAPDERFASFTFDHVFDGEILAQGEDMSDRWLLIVKDNVVTVEALR
jgi:hypothetical protein